MPTRQPFKGQGADVYYQPTHEPPRPVSEPTAAPRRGKTRRPLTTVTLHIGRDQEERLKAEARRRNDANEEDASLAAIVREAIDEYFARRS